MIDFIPKISDLFSSVRNEDTLVAISANTHYRWCDYTASVQSLAAQLTADSASRWLLYCDDAYQFAVAFMALLVSAKTIILPPNAQLGTLQELAANADGILIDKAFDDDSLSVLLIDSCLAMQQEIVIDDYSLARGLAKLNPNLTIEVMTSGSEGANKRIVKKLYHFDAEIIELERLWGTMLADSLIFSTVSHQHIYGLLFRVLWPLCAGRVMVSHTYQYPETLFADMGAVGQSPHWCDHVSSVLISSPAHLKRIPDSINLAESCRSIKAIFCSGGPLPMRSALDLTMRLGFSPLEVLGSSETGGVAWRSQSLPLEAKWHKFDRVDIRLAEGSEQLEIKSPFCFSDQWYAMGDNIVLADGGGFYLKGRTDRIVKIEEKRLSLTQMECKLVDSDWIDEVRVVPLFSSRDSLAVVAVLSKQGEQLLLSEGKLAINQQIKTHLSQFFERILLPRKFRYVDTLPTNEQGKTVMAQLVALFESVSSKNSTALNVNSAIMPSISVVEQTVGKLIMVMALPASDVAFAGHFPDAPILPGVMQLGIVVVQMQRYFYPHLLFKRVEKLKFQAVIRPTNRLYLTIEQLSDNTACFRYFNADKELSSGTITFGGVDEF